MHYIAHWSEPPSSTDEVLLWRIYVLCWEANGDPDPGYWIRQWLLKYSFTELHSEVQDWLRIITIPKHGSSR